jgi:hypothetical protein
MQGRLAFCARLGVLTLALAACSADTSTEPTDPDPGQPPIAATHKWSDPATWPGGQVPVAGAAVVIPPELNVLLDLSPPPLTSLTVQGALVFDQATGLIHLKLVTKTGRDWATGFVEPQ